MKSGRNGSLTVRAGAAIVHFAILASFPAVAHHSFAATYFPDKTITVEGEIVQFVYRNPHSLLQVVAQTPDGKTCRWAVEWAAALDLDRTGVIKEMIRPGDHVILTGNPARNPNDHRMRLQKIERPADGWRWQRDYQ